MESAGRSRRDELAAGIGHGAQHRDIRSPRQSENATRLVEKQIQNGCPVPLLLLLYAPIFINFRVSKS